jgi:hypothetical protein
MNDSQFRAAAGNAERPSLAQLPAPTAGIRLAALISLPFLALVVFDLAYLGRSYLDGSSGDNLQLYFSIAYAWLHSHWPPMTHLVTHHPGMPLAGLLTLLLAVQGTPSSDLTPFAVFGIVINVATILAVSAWSAWLVTRWRLPKMPVVIAAALIAVMPTITAFNTTLVGYYSYGLLLLPIGIGLYVVLSQKADHATVFSTYAGLGFALTLNYIAAIVVVAVLVTIAIVPSTARAQMTTPPMSWWDRVGDIAIAIFFLGCGSFALRALIWYAQIPAGSYKSWLTAGAYAGAALAATLLVLAMRRISWCKPYFAVGGPLAIGWLAGANLLALEWSFGAAFAILYRGGNTPVKMTFWEKLQAFNPGPFFLESAWHWVILALLIAGIWMIWRSIDEASQLRHQDRALGVFVLVIMALDLVATFDISFLVPRPDYILVSSRFHMSTIVAIPVVLLWLKQNQPTYAAWAGTAAGVVSLITLIQYPQVVADGTAKANARNLEASALVEQFLTSQPDGAVLCFATFIPRQCSLAHAWWRISLLNTRFDEHYRPEMHRVRSLGSLSEFQAMQSTGPVLLLSEHEVPDTGGDTARKVMRYEDFPALFVYEVAAKAAPRN